MASFCHYDEKQGLFLAEQACKNITWCWTGVCFPVFHNSLWHEECQRWTPSHNRFPVQAPMMELCITASSPAGLPVGCSTYILLADSKRQAGKQSASDSTCIKPVEQLVSHTGKSVRARGGLAHAAQHSVIQMQHTIPQAFTVTALSSCSTVHTALWIWICYESRWWQHSACLCTLRNTAV